ncbi:MAG TPA: hypothetical protein PKC32_07265, partial [Sphingopyxis sp.]|nr:hypothetical protein [Sphingopyxis sp.]
MILSASLFGLAWTGAAAAQQTDVAPPAVVPTVEPQATETQNIAAPTPPPPEAQLPEVAPIIPDEEFKSAIPPISAEDDPELDKPLESIAEFERRQAEAAKAKAAGTPAETTAADVPQVDGTPVPALADGDSVEAIGDAPISDAELAAPLPPLGSFDVTPVEFAEPEDKNETRTIHYAVKVNGLAAADDGTDADLADLFDDLSALHDGDWDVAQASQQSHRNQASGLVAAHLQW